SMGCLPSIRVQSFAPTLRVLFGDPTGNFRRLKEQVNHITGEPAHLRELWPRASPRFPETRACRNPAESRRKLGGNLAGTPRLPTFGVSADPYRGLRRAPLTASPA